MLARTMITDSPIPQQVHKAESVLSKYMRLVILTLEPFPKKLTFTVFGVFQDPKDLTSFKTEGLYALLSASVFLQVACWRSITLLI